MRKANNIQSSATYRPEIDGLRAIAVIAVIINHFNKEILPSGYLGVDIFFVISGFVITSSLAVRQSLNFNDFIIGFYQRRLKRLIPALICFVVITSLLTTLFASNPFFKLALGFSSLFGFSNLLLFFKSTDYFATSTLFNPFTHTWSLGVEEQFYLFFPLIIWFTGFSKKVRKSTRNLIMVLLPLTIISLFSYLIFYENNHPAAYFLMPNRFWEMSFGSLIFLFQGDNSLIRKKISNLSPEIILFLLIASLFIPMSYGRISSLLVVILTSLLIITLKKGNLAYKILTKKNIVYIGLISYSLYLWHWGILAISRNTIGIYWWSWPFQVILIVLFSILSYEYVEKKFKKYKFKSNRLFSTFDFLRVILLSAFLITALGLGKFFKKIPNISYQSPKGNGKSVSESERCMKGNIESCFKKETSSKSVFSLGDSHLMNYVPSLRISLFNLGYQTYFWGAAKHIRDIFSSNCSSQTCYLLEVNKIKEVLEKNNFNKNDILIYSLSRNRLYLDEKISNMQKFYNFEGFSRDGLENKPKIKILDSAIRSLIEFVSSKDGKFILIDDLPLACGIKEWHANLRPCKVSKYISLKDRMPLTKLFRSISSDYKNVFYVDPHDFICVDEICLPNKNNIPLYVDNSPHLSLEAKNVLAPFFQDQFRQILDE